MSTVLGIETSCDECSAAIVLRAHGQLKVRSLATFSQIGIHKPFGGVVPEIASRNHLETVNTMIDQALEQASLRLQDLDAIAVTNRPGLVGSLLVGVSAAKSLAYATQKPLIPVHHLEGHAISPFLDNDEIPQDLPLPLLIAVISGGHTNLYIARSQPELWPPDFLKKSLIARSRDDAAGEAFDKTAKTLGFPYPGGQWIDQTATKGNPQAFTFPKALPQKSTYDFSFSGLKTAVALTTEKLNKKNNLKPHLADLCASIQEAIIDALLGKIFLAARDFKCQSLAIVGGVAANSRLRVRLQQEWHQSDLSMPPLFPKMSYCTDNAAMIAGAGIIHYLQGRILSNKEMLTLNAIAHEE